MEELLSLSQWRKKHRDRTDFGPFKNRPHPIRKTKKEDRTIYFCLRCRVSFVDLKPNKLKQPKAKKWHRDNYKKPESTVWIEKLDRLWVKAVKLRADYKSEISGKGNSELCLIDAHHILGKSTLALRYSLENGICLTRAEHQDIAHSPDVNKQIEFKLWAIKIRGTNKDQVLSRFEFGKSDYEEIYDYLKFSIAELKGEGKREPALELEAEGMYFP